MNNSLEIKKKEFEFIYYKQILESVLFKYNLWINLNISLFMIMTRKYNVDVILFLLF